MNGKDISLDSGWVQPLHIVLKREMHPTIAHTIEALCED
jgi:hypothetical protein